MAACEVLMGSVMQTKSTHTGEGLKGRLVRSPLLLPRCCNTGDAGALVEFLESQSNNVAEMPLVALASASLSKGTRYSPRL